MTVPLTDPVVKAIADKHGKSPAQILIKHLAQKGFMVIPKSIKQVRTYKRERDHSSLSQTCFSPLLSQHRIKENYSVHDFTLTPSEMQQMDDLDKGSAARTFFLDFMKSKDRDITTLPTWPDDPRDQY